MVELQLALLGECGNGPPPSWHTRTTTGRQRQRAAATFPVEAEEVDGPISSAPTQRTRVKSRRPSSAATEWMGAKATPATRCSRRAYVECVTEMARVELELAKECGRYLWHRIGI
uniref:Uncharacterized protein n=1 Tax=Oryza meridionalis TaxID=40149 RepID=A0A0E0FCU1_9ORYZ